MCKFYDILQIKLLIPPTPPSCDKRNYDKLLVLFRPTPPKEIMTKMDFSKGFQWQNFITTSLYKGRISQNEVNKDGQGKKEPKLLTILHYLCCL